MTIRSFSVLRPAGVASVLFLAGCGGLLETPYEAPQSEMPQGWWQEAPPEPPPAGGGGGTLDIAGPDAWWLAFDDPVLTALIEKALERNNDLAAAAIKVRRARLQAGLSERSLWPSLSASGTESISRNLRGNTKPTRSYSLTGSVAYEVDLWGKLSREVDADRWEAAATELDRDSTALSLTTTTATLYWQILYYRERLALARDSIAYTQNTLDLARVRRESGATSALEVLEAEQSVLTQQSQVTQLEQSLVESETALAVLFDGPPAETDLSGTKMPRRQMPEVAAGLPSGLLARRPDIRAAELRLRESLATVDATRASYLPTFSLTGSAGTSSVTLKEVLSTPVTTLGMTLALPFLNWNEMRYNIKISQADYEQAVVEYRQSLYEALAEVENALSARRTYASQATSLIQALRTAIEVERIYEDRYDAGAATMQDWLDAQEKRRSLQESLAENRFNRLQAQVTLVKALGGGLGNRQTP